MTIKSTKKMNFNYKLKNLFLKMMNIPKKIFN